MVIFGGLYELTKELNDLYLFDMDNEVWIPIFMGETKKMLKNMQALNDYVKGETINNLRQSYSGLGSSLNYNKPQPALTSNNDTNGGISSTLDPGQDPYAITTSNRTKTADKMVSKRSSKSILMLRAVKGGARSNSRMIPEQSNKSCIPSNRKLSQEQSMHLQVRRQVLNSEFCRLHSARYMETPRGSEMCYSQGYGIQMQRTESEASNYIKVLSIQSNAKREASIKKEEDSKPQRVFGRQFEDSSYYNSNQKNESIFMMKNLKRINPMDLKKQMEVKNLKANISNALSMKLIFNK
jgi:hypothetical protein